jgi:hypothetical protein
MSLVTNPVRVARALAAVAGMMDLLTGLALVMAPQWTLTLMRVPAATVEAEVYLRFVGAFVGAVGAAYLQAALARREAALWTLLRVTLWFRLAAGSYAASAIVAGWLPSAWWSVPVVDLTLVASQVFLIPRHER